MVFYLAHKIFTNVGVIHFMGRERERERVWGGGGGGLNKNVL